MAVKKKLNISFSGGRTSAFMTKWLIDNKSDEYDFVVTFANTGQEHEETLKFIKKCDDEWGFNTVWIEAEFHKGLRIDEDGNDDRSADRSGLRATHKIVSFETACRDASLFEDMISFADYGIPNKAYPHCTRELKQAPMEDYLRHIGWWKSCEVAIGIRIDERKRVNKKAIDFDIVYPLVDMMPITKGEIIDWFSSQQFDLLIPERLGNCIWCWKKSMKKHIQLIHENPGIFDAPRDFEAKYGLCGKHDDDNKRVFFRGNRSTDDLLKIAALGEQMSLLPDSIQNEIYAEDATSDCGESCEVFPLEEI